MSSFAALGIAIRRSSRVEQRVACPQCAKGGRDDALGVNIEDGRFHCFRCGWKGRAGGEGGAPRHVTHIDDPARAERVRKRLREVWDASAALSDQVACPVRRYLETRGLVGVLAAPPTSLRAHPSLAYFDSLTMREVGRYPAMLALLSDRNGEGCTVHATYLRADGRGKAPVPSPKKILGVPVRGATKGGAIRLYEPRDGRLGIAEGLESALSLGLIRGITVWSSYCAENLAAVCLPPRLHELEIGVDVDLSGKGESAARALAARVLRARLARRVRLILPDGQGPRDLNDELRARAG